MMRRLLTLAAGAAMAPFLVSACAGNPEQAKLPAGTVDVAFLLTLGDEPAKCGHTYSGVGSASADMSLQDARLYVSNFRLIAADGAESPLLLEQDGVWQRDDLALLDFEDATGGCNGNPVTNTTVRGTTAGVDHVGLAFDIGVPERMNHQDPTLAAAPLNQSALSWPWRFGYKYLTVDLETAIRTGAVEGAPGFSIHVGATNCGDGPPMQAPSVACALQNRPAVRLEHFNPASDVVVIDLAELLAYTDLTTNQPHTASGCMSAPDDSDCDGIFVRAGLRGTPQRFVRAAPMRGFASTW